MYRILLLLILISLTHLAMAEIRDPTEPPWYSGPRSSNGGYELQSILYSSSRQVAIINGQLVKVGDRINQAKVIKITSNTVVLEKNKKQMTIHLISPQLQSIKRAPKKDLKD